MGKGALKSKVVEAGSCCPGAVSVLGSWQVCHQLCLGVVALLGGLGIAMSGMPLMFLTRLAMPFWIAAALLLLLTLALHVRRGLFSSKLVLLNAGLITAGVPFPQLQAYSPLFWIVGGGMVLGSTALFLRERFIGR